MTVVEMKLSGASYYWKIINFTSVTVALLIISL